MFTVGGFTLMSRILGFVRDKLIGNYLGAGAAGDVWAAAFFIPNLFRRIFGEGAFNAAFVPMYSRRLEEDGEETADLFARRVITVMTLLLIGIFALCFVFMEPVVKLTNLGFTHEDGRLDAGVAAARVTIVYLIFICLVAALSGILNSRRILGAPAFAYVALNIVFIVALIVFAPRAEDPLVVLTWSVVAAGIVQLAIVAYACKRAGIRLSPRRPAIDEDVRRLGSLMAPGLVSAGIQQINLIVGGTVASLVVGGRSLIYYADRINQLPLGIIGMAAGVVLLPEITRNLRGGDESGARRSMARGLEMSMLLTLPAMVAMIVIPREIMFAIFQGGEFAGKDALAAGAVLQAFAIGTPAYVIARVLQPGYFAREDTRTPMNFTIATAVTNILLCWPLFIWLGPAGCALATSIAGWVNVVLLWIGLGRLGFLEMSPGFSGRMARMLLSAVLMGAAVWGLARLGSTWILADGQFFLRMIALTILVAIGVVAYFAFVFALRVFSVSEVKNVLRRKGTGT